MHPSIGCSQYDSGISHHRACVDIGEARVGQIAPGSTILNRPMCTTIHSSNDRTGTPDSRADPGGRKGNIMQQIPLGQRMLPEPAGLSVAWTVL